MEGGTLEQEEEVAESEGDAFVGGFYTEADELRLELDDEDELLELELEDEDQLLLLEPEDVHDHVVFWRLASSTSSSSNSKALLEAVILLYDYF